MIIEPFKGENGPIFFPKNSSPSIPIEPIKLAILIVWFICAVISNWIVLAFVHDLVDWNPMQDPMFLLPQQEWARTLGDLMVSLSFTSLCLLLIFHRNRFLLFRRLLFILALLNSHRFVMIMLTRLPSSYSDNAQKCRPKVLNANCWLWMQRTLEQAIRLGLQDDSQKVLCGDQLFSGHTAMMTTCALCMDYYLPEKWKLASWLPKLFALIGIPCMVLSRTHYSCDVLIGYWLSAIIFLIYHAICEIHENENVVDNKSTFYRTFLFAKLIHWFEENMPKGRPKNEWQIPFWYELLQKWPWRKEMVIKHEREESNRESNSFSKIFFVNSP